MKKLMFSIALNLVLIVVIILGAVNNQKQARAAMAPYLEETRFCDYNNTAFDNFKMDESLSDREKAVHIFEYVRDNWAVEYDPLDTPASVTYKKRQGVCWNKALLMVALLRKQGIPARMIKVPLDREFTRPLIGETCTQLPELVYHCFTQVYVDNKWIYADPTLDAKAYAKFAAINVDWDMNWDGTKDHIIYTEYIRSVFDIIQDIDGTLSTTIGNPTEY